MITRRDQRARLLVKAGFLPFEVKPFSMIPLTVPYFKRLVEDRRKEHEDWLGDLDFGTGDVSRIWLNYILDIYKQNGWYKPVGLGRIILDPYRLLRKYEHGYRAKQPEYESPWEKRSKSMPDFIAKFNRTLEKQAGRVQARESYRRTVLA